MWLTMKWWKSVCHSGRNTGWSLRKREQLLDEDEDQRRAEQVEDEPVEPDVRRVVGEVVDRHLVAAERKRQADQRERARRQPARAAEHDVEQRNAAGHDHRPVQQLAHQRRRRSSCAAAASSGIRESERRARRGSTAPRASSAITPETRPWPAFSEPCDSLSWLSLSSICRGRWLGTRPPLLRLRRRLDVAFSAGAGTIDSRIASPPARPLLTAARRARAGCATNSHRCLRISVSRMSLQASTRSQIDRVRLDARERANDVFADLLRVPWFSDRRSRHRARSGMPGSG